MAQTAEQFLQELVSLGYRQGNVEVQARELITNILTEHGLAYSVNLYDTQLPDYKHISLTADGVEVPCLPTGLKSGSLDSNYSLISSLISSQKFIDEPNINFNPRCRDAISQSNFYHAPSWAINVADVQTLAQAEEVKAELEVEPYIHQAANILVGNLENPKNIVFTHYDSIELGAIDNASGSYMTMRLILDAPETLVDTLYVFDGNEELSYDYPIYWGRGYREFQKTYGSLMESCENIIILDSLGNTKTLVSNDPHLVRLGFPVENMESLVDKVSFYMGEYDDLMKVYQSSADTLDGLSQEYFDEAFQMVKSSLIES